MPVIEQSAVREELSKILDSPEFARSPRMSRFLKFVVENTLDGRGEEIKEYVIGLEVFDKPETYDPQTDSTVRTEASKLRRRLGLYYETAGRADQIVISIPKGGYVPVFEERRPDHSRPESSPKQRWKWKAAGATALLAICAAIFWMFAPPKPADVTLSPLTSLPGAEDQPSISPDGTRVAFRWKRDIYVKLIGTETLSHVTRGSANDSWPAWSPDGRRIAFVRRGDVLVVPADGGEEYKFAESVGRVVWVPDGTAVLVLQQTSHYARSIFRVALSNGEKHRLTFPEPMSSGDMDMAISPDGRWLGFCRTLTGEGCDLYLMPSGGGEARRLTEDRRVILGFAWTPDSRQLVFASNRQRWYRLWHVVAHGSGKPEPVDGAGDDARYPSIARSGRLVYQRYGRDFDIARAPITGNEGESTHRLGSSEPWNRSTRIDAMPSWAPDGKRIAFRSDRSGTPEIWVADADGSDSIKLTAFGGASVLFPRWSPDGRRIIFCADTGPDTNFEGFTVASTGGVPERIRVPGNRSMAHPIFSRDGRWIYFIPGPKEGAVQVWKMSAGGGQPIRVTDGDAFRPEESVDSKLLYYGRYGTHSLWSTPIGGRAARQVLNSITGTDWTLTPAGIYYIDFGAEANAPKPLKFYSFRSEKSATIGQVEAGVSPDITGISVSPDGRWLLYSYIPEITSDLMLLDTRH